MRLVKCRALANIIPRRTNVVTLSMTRQALTAAYAPGIVSIISITASITRQLTKEVGFAKLLPENFGTENIREA
jgi:hypothetical protein